MLLYLLLANMGIQLALTMCPIVPICVQTTPLSHYVPYAPMCFQITHFSHYVPYVPMCFQITHFSHYVPYVPYVPMCLCVSKLHTFLCATMCFQITHFSHYVPYVPMCFQKSTLCVLYVFPPTTPPKAEKKALLIQANIQLEITRHYFRLGYDLGLYASTQYQHFAEVYEAGHQTVFIKTTLQLIYW